MAEDKKTLTTKVQSGSPYQLDPAQTLRASTALLKKISSDEVAQKENAPKANLLEDADASDDEDAGEDNSTPVWLVLTTKKHMADQKRMKPGKIVVPHPLHSASSPELRVCLITADPQRKYKDMIADPRFPSALASRITRVVGMEKVKSKYKTYESRRQLFAEYDIFLADDRIITYLPTALGKVFYASGAKRPIPINLQGRPENNLENGAKRVKLSEGGQKIKRVEPKPEDMAREIERSMGAALVHLAPSTNTSVKVARASYTPDQVAANIDAVVNGLTEKFVPKGWKNVRAIHIKGPNTAALPIWLADELWEDVADILEKVPEPRAVGQAKKDKKKRKRALIDAEPVKDEDEEVSKSKKRKSLDGEETKAKKVKSDAAASEKAARKAALKKQKEEAKAAVAAA